LVDSRFAVFFLSVFFLVIIELIIILAISRWRDVTKSSLTQQVTPTASARSNGSLKQPSPSALHIALSFQEVLK